MEVSLARAMESFDFIVSVTVRHGLLQILTVLRNGTQSQSLSVAFGEKPVKLH